MSPNAAVGWILALAMLVIGAEAGAQGAATSAALPASGAATRLLPVEVVLNKSNVGAHTLLEHEGALYATAETIAEWRLAVPTGQSVQFRGEKWLPLFAIPGYRARFDFASQSVELEFSPAEFGATRIGNEVAPRAPLSPKAPAVFVNYDVSHTESRQKDAGAVRDTGAILELGVAHGPGVLTSGFVGRNLGSTGEARGSEWIRLETLWTRDFPEINSTLRVGDTSTPAGMWGRPVFYGGIQFARNFALTPGFLSQPLPTVAGSASGPSTVELYVNDALRHTSQVPSGPFTLENLPLFTGAGEARVVVRDVLGRETVIVRPFFTNNQLLAPGLSDWSVDAGRLRRNLGTLSADYGERFLAGLYRQGLNETFTVEARADISGSVRGAGAGVTAALPFDILGQAAVAASSADGERSGGTMLLGVEQAGLRNSFSARFAQSTRSYRQLGFAENELPYKSEFSANYRHSIGERSSVGLGAARLARFDQPAVNTVSASFSTRVGERGSIVFSATRVTGSAASSASALMVSLILPLDARRIASANASRRDGQLEAYAGVTDPIGAETGLGWRTLAGRRSREDFVEGGLYYQGNHGSLSADAKATRDNQALRVGAQGALVAIDGRFFASRRLEESFAVVEVAGYQGVGVGFQGTVLTHTDKDGLALLPRLLPYQRNSVQLDPNDLPFSAELDSIEEVAVPSWRSGVKIRFPVRSGRGALVRILLEDGDAAPAGADVRLSGDNKEFFVARRGEAFITGLQPRNTLRLQWNEQSCAIEVELPPGDPNEIPRLGPFVCAGVRR